MIFSEYNENVIERDDRYDTINKNESLVKYLV